MPNPQEDFVSQSGAVRTPDGTFVVWQARIRRIARSIRDDRDPIDWWGQEIGAEVRTAHGRLALSSRALPPNESRSDDSYGPVVDGSVDEAAVVPRLVTSNAFGSSDLGHAHVVVLAATDEQLNWLYAWAAPDAEDPLPGLSGRNPVITLRPTGQPLWIGLFDLST